MQSRFGLEITSETYRLTIHDNKQGVRIYVDGNEIDTKSQDTSKHCLGKHFDYYYLLVIAI